MGVDAAKSLSLPITAKAVLISASTHKRGQSYRNVAKWLDEKWRFDEWLVEKRYLLE